MMPACCFRGHVTWSLPLPPPLSTENVMVCMLLLAFFWFWRVFIFFPDMACIWLSCEYFLFLLHVDRHPKSKLIARSSGLRSLLQFVPETGSWWKGNQFRLWQSSLKEVNSPFIRIPWCIFLFLIFVWHLYTFLYQASVVYKKCTLYIYMHIHTYFIFRLIFCS